MNRRQIALKLILEELDSSISSKLIDNHTILQNFIYLFQNCEFGINYKFVWSWSLLCPFSFDLLEEFLYVNQNGNVDGWYISEDNKKIIQNVQQFIFNTINSTEYIKKLTTFLFLINTKQTTITDYEKTKEIFLRIGHKVEIYEIEKYLSDLKLLTIL